VLNSAGIAGRRRLDRKKGDRVMQDRAETALPDPTTRLYEPPCFEVIPLDCEITAYAPDAEPLF